MFITRLLAIALLLLVAPLSHAGEGMFQRAYTTETVPEGHFELEQMVRQRTHRAFGSYTAYDFASEFEYGITDDLQMAVYVNSEKLTANNAPDDNDPNGETGFSRNNFFLSSIATEFIYRPFSPIKNWIGLAFYLEPEVNFYDMHNGVKERDSFSSEYRILLQKNLLDDKLIIAYNMVVEIEYFRYGGTRPDGDFPFQGELDWNHELGITYRWADRWYAGLEARNHNELGNFWSHDHSIYWAGPSVHYGAPRFWATFGVLTEVYGVPSGPDEQGSDQGPSGKFLHSHEQYETTLKVAMPF